MYKVALKENADVYHCVGVYAIIPGFFLKILNNKKVIYDACEIAPLAVDFLDFPDTIRRILKIMVDLFEKFVVSRVDYILTVPSVGDIFKKKYMLLNKNVLVIWNVPDKNTYGKINNVVHKNGYCRHNYTTTNLIYCGTKLAERKGIKALLNALSYIVTKHKTVKLILIGEKSSEFYDIVKKVSTEWNYDISQNIETVDIVPWNTIWNYLIQGKIGIKLYTQEQIYLVTLGSSSIFEYMAASLPIVTSNFGGWRLIISSCRCGVNVNPANPKEIAEKIVYLIENPKNLRKMSINARRAFERKFNWNKEEKKLLKVYEVVINGRLKNNRKSC